MTPIFQELAVLSRARRQMVINDVTRLTKEKVARFLLLLVIGAAFFWLDYLFFHRIISYITKIDVLDAVEIGNLLVARLLSMIFLLFASMLLFSNIVTSLSTLYLSSDLHFLLSSPIRFSSVFLTKFVETTVNSSTILLVFGLPIFIVCGQEYQTSWVYYLMIPLTLLPFIIIPASLGTLATMLLVRYFPVKRVQQVFVVFGLILGAGVVIVFRFLRPEQIVNEVGMEQLLGYIRSNRIPTAPYLPSTWAAETLMSLLERRPATAFTNWLWLILAAAALYLIVLYAAQFIYYAGWTGNAESRTVKVSKRGTLTERLLLRVRFLHPTTRSLLIKDIKLFWRDTTQWSQLLMLAALLLIYFFNIKSLPVQNPHLKNMLSFLNLGVAGFVLASLGARFVFPSTSLEGNGFWILHSAPIDYRRFLLEKFFIFLFPLLLLAETLIVISNILLDVSGYMMFLSTVTIFMMTVGLTGLGVGMGAMYPKFINENPAQIAMSIGGILYMILSLIYIGVIIVIQAWPVYIYFSQQFLRPVGANAYLGQYAAYGGVMLLSAGVTIFPLHLGVKRLNAFEIV